MKLFDYEREGYFGEFGGAYIPEILKSTVDELKAEFRKAKEDPAFWEEYIALLKEYCGRPTPITHLKNLSEQLGGAQIYVKREDLNHTGAHKANNVMGQGLLVKRMGKKRVIAETGAGQHGVATATMAAKLGLECTIYMGAVDVKRQRPNVFWMEQMGATVIPVEKGQQTLKDAINECLRDWVESMDDTHYALGTACGFHPFPEMVSWFQSIIGLESKDQIKTLAGKLPDKVFACVGGGSNAMGIFQGFMDDPEVELVGCEGGGHGMALGMHSARLAEGTTATMGVSGYKTMFIQSDEGQMQNTHSVAAGMDYVGVSPILAHLAKEGTARFEAPTDQDVVAALKLTMKNEGLIPALESSHAFAQAYKEAPKMRKDQVILINQSGRGDKDIFTIAEALEDPKWVDFLRSKVAEYDAS
jgi:tryptophan synthase beta chain